MDKVRELERRKKRRFTYTTSESLLRQIKILAIQNDINVNELLDIAIERLMLNIVNGKVHR